jgi:acyl CoA:acetate/3-ketoacid CoA transferase alpha subunit
LTKVRSLRDAVADVADGAHVAFGGFAITRCVVAAAGELVRAGKRELELTQVIGGLDTDLAVGGGCVRKLRYSGGSLDRFGPLACVNRAIATGALELEEYSSLALTLRLHAAGLGLPYVTAATMLGSDLLGKMAERGDAVRVERSPFTGAPVLALAPLRPDIAFIHVDVADEAGNATISGPTWSARQTALAAARTVLIAEEVVSVGSLDPDAVTIAAPFVSAVCHVEYGALPTAAYGRYDYDRDRLTDYASAAGEGGATYEDYLDANIRGRT